LSGGAGVPGSPQQVNVGLQVAPAPLSLQASTDKTVYNPGDTLTVTTTLTQGGTPITNATAQAQLVEPDNTQQVVALTNGGAGNVYTGTLTLSSATGTGALYVTASAPGGFSA